MKIEFTYIRYLFLIPALALGAALTLSCWSEFDDAYDERWEFGMRRIVFMSTRDGNEEIYVMNEDGTNQTRLSNSSGRDTMPEWSRDGTRIVFISRRDGIDQIYTMNPDGTNQTRVTYTGVAEAEPTWSPDGSRIAYNEIGEIWIMNADGSGPIRLTFTGNNQTPVWSPDGVHIAFISTRITGNWEIWLMNIADPANPVNLTNNAADDFGSAWSPDGSRIAFMRNSNIYIMNADGSNQTQITFTGNDQPSSWSSDGALIVYTHSNDIWVINADGSGSPVQLTNNAAIDNQPCWSPF